MIIKVTKEHIKKAQRIRSEAWASSDVAETSCPIAQALKEEYPKVRVSTKSIVLDGIVKGEKCRYHLLPEKAKTFVKIFDEMGVGSPFEFNI